MKLKIKIMIKLKKYFLLIILEFFSSDALSESINKTIFNPYCEFTEYLGKKGDFSLKEVINKNNLKYITFAFIQDADKCLPAWDGIKNNKIDGEEIINLLNEVKTTNISYFISFGRQYGNDLALNCKNPKYLLKIYEKIIKIYQPIGLDFDLEGKILDNRVALNKLIITINNLQKIHQNLKVSITIPVMPSGLNLSTKKLLSKLKESKIKFTVNLLTMNFSEKLSENMFKYTLYSIKNSLNNLQEINRKEFLNSISVTPMIGVNDLKNEVFTIQDAKNLTLESSKLNLSEIRMWSLERDKRCTKRVNLKICSGLKNQKNYEFTEIFNSLNIEK